MSNGYELEIISDGSGGAWLIYEDRPWGNDWVWHIGEDGKLISYPANTHNNELAFALLQLVRALDEEAGDG